MQRWAIGLEYNGAAFCGWQSQKNGGGVQDAVQQAILPLAGEVVVHGAGRTDSGAHAALQIAHFETEVSRSSLDWVCGINGGLPKEARVLWAQATADDFHARYSACRRSYQYILLNRFVASAFMQKTTAYYRNPLDLSLMQKALSYLVGEQDFSAFRASSCQAKSPIRHVHVATVIRREDLLIFDFCASGFLHHMIRNIIGAVLVIGQQKKEPEWINELLQKKDRKLGAKTASAAGLYFTGANYPTHFGLPESVRVPFVVGE